jgi:hypothetical protein
MSAEARRSVVEIFRDRALIDKALARGVRDALLFHKRIGNPIAVWRDGRVVNIPADQIQIPVIDEEDERN